MVAAAAAETSGRNGTNILPPWWLRQALEIESTPGLCTYLRTFIRKLVVGLRFAAACAASIGGVVCKLIMKEIRSD